MNGILGKPLTCNLFQRYGKSNILSTDRNKIEYPNFEGSFSILDTRNFESLLKIGKENKITNIIIIDSSLIYLSKGKNQNEESENNYFLESCQNAFKVAKEIKASILIPSTFDVFTNSNQDLITDDHIHKPISHKGIVNVTINIKNSRMSKNLEFTLIKFMVLIIDR